MLKNLNIGSLLAAAALGAGAVIGLQMTSDDQALAQAKTAGYAYEHGLGDLPAAFEGHLDRSELVEFDEARTTLERELEGSNAAQINAAHVALISETNSLASIAGMSVEGEIMLNAYRSPDSRRDAAFDRLSESSSALIDAVDSGSGAVDELNELMDAYEKARELR
jgi:hypothetical protein